ncbi:hypothetical protein BH11ACT1_BH11ACT1_02000 [soil metagenome]
MSPFDDDRIMRAGDEELLRGTAVNAEPALTALVAMLRESAEAPGPRPTDALATLLRTGRAPGAVAPRPFAASKAVPLAVRLRRLMSRAAALGLAAKIALTAGVAVASVGTAAAVGGLPSGVQERASETLGHIVAVFAPGHQHDTDDGASTTPTPNGAAALPGTAGSDSQRPTQDASPTDLPTSAEARGEARKGLPDAATSNRAAPEQGPGAAGSASSTAPGPSSAQAQDAHSADRAVDPSPGTSNGNEATGRETTAAATPTPTPTPEQTRSAGRG